MRSRPSIQWLLLCALMLLPGTSSYAQSEQDTKDVAALRMEARSYEHGEGVAKDIARAVTLYCAAAKLGDAEAQFGLGWMYANARGVPRNDALAAFFFALAAKQEHEHAVKMLRFVGDPATEPPECMQDKPAPAQTTKVEPKVEVEQTQPKDFIAVTAAQKQALELVNKFAPEFGVHPQLALAVIRTESNFDPAARSEKNAQGLMQLIPETSARFNVAKPFDPAQNIRGGLAYLRWLLAYFEGNVSLVAAAYNAGEGTVNRYRGLPPFAETRAYVKRVMTLFGRKEHPYDARVTNPSPELGRIRAITRF